MAVFSVLVKSYQFFILIKIRMIKNLPQNAKQLSMDKELYKVILEEGNKKNRLANLNDTCVGAAYIIKTYDDKENQVIDYTKGDSPAAWIVGDKESECTIYMFLQIGIRSMCEGETAQFFFTKKYLLGDVPFVNEEGKIFQADTFTAIVKLIKATPLDQINLLPELKMETTTKPSTENQDKVEKSDEVKIKIESESNKEKNDVKGNSEEQNFLKTKKVVEVENDESFQRRKFALNQLKVAESLLQAKKPAAARKEFNRARMSWSTQVDLSKAPEAITHEALDLPEDELKKYVNSRALYGVARTFLEIVPPNTEKAVLSLQEAIELDNDFFEAKMTLESLGQKVDDTEFPEFEDKRLTKQQYWLKPEVEWSKREEYSAYVKEKATALFKENNFKEALDLYKRCIIPFSGQSKIKSTLTREQISAMNKVNIISKLNSLACYMLLKEYPKVVVHADELFDTICKMEPSIIDEDNNNNDSNLNDNSNENSNSNTNTNTDNSTPASTNDTSNDNSNTNSENKDNVENKLCNEYKLKCLYRKALANHEMQMSDNVDFTIKQMEDIKGSAKYIQAIRRKQQDDAKFHQKDQDAMYSKMIMSMKNIL